MSSSAPRSTLAAVAAAVAVVGQSASAFTAPPAGAPQHLETLAGGGAAHKGTAAQAQQAPSQAVVFASALGVAAAAGALTRGIVGNSRTVTSSRSRVVAARAFENELGVQKPTGFWDPIGFTKDGNMDAYTRRRITEIKHGRVSMLACMGYITPEFFKWPGYLSPAAGLKFEDVPNGLAAISKVPGPGWVQIVLWCLYCEGTGGFGYNQDGQKKNPGDCGWKPPLLATTDVELKKKRLNAELANGRLAMVAIIGMFFQDGLTGSAWGSWDLYTDSPLRAFENELGVQKPTGFWDPIGFTKDGNMDAYTRRRITEIKHGRVSMLACMGYITPEFFKWPGYLSPAAGLKFEDVPNGLAAISKVPGPGWVQIVLWCLYCEGTGGFGYNQDGQKKSPGDCGWKPPLLATTDVELRKKRLNAELANGRLAMVAIIGMFFQDGLTGSAWGSWDLYTDSPLRAFENELGVQSPIGFYDPVGFSADGDVRAFRRRRSVELKHGRISMLACMGYMTPELTGKFPGYLSPSAGLKFTDVPNGLAAIAKVPALGWAQIAAYFGFVEFLGGFDDYKTGTPGDYGWKALTSSDPAVRQSKLQAELANGRLAMIAIIAMFVQNGITGTTGPEMWSGEAPSGRTL